MSCTPAPACVAALKEATRLWPDRRKTSDGICASLKHSTQNPTSDHEPRITIGTKAYATAFDLSDDKAAGCDADALVEQLRTSRDPRVKYVIAERRMFSSYATKTCAAWQWRPYTGANPHSSHVHVSIVPGAIHDTSPWWGGEPEELDIMDAATKAYLDGQFAAVGGRLQHLELEVAILRDAVKGKAADANGVSWLGERMAEIKASLKDIAAKVG